MDGLGTLLSMKSRTQMPLLHPWQQVVLKHVHLWCHWSQWKFLSIACHEFCHAQFWNRYEKSVLCVLLSFRMVYTFINLRNCLMSSSEIGLALLYMLWQRANSWKSFLNFLDVDSAAAAREWSSREMVVMQLHSFSIVVVWKVTFLYDSQLDNPYN